MRRPILLALLFLCLLTLVFYYLGVNFRPVFSYINSEGSVVKMSGLVCNVQIKEDYYALTVKTGRKFIFPEKVLVRISLDVSLSEVFSLLGKEVSFAGELSLADGERNPGTFNYNLYLKGRGIGGIVQVSKYKFSVLDTKNLFLNLAGIVKGKCLDRLKQNMSEEGFSVISGLLFGEKGYLSEDLYKSFRDNGIAHVLAVSGLHVGFIYALFLKIIGKKRGILSDACALFFLFLYVCMAGFSYSSLRAFCMVFLNMLAFHTNRRYDIVSAAGLTAIIFIIANPYSIFDTGSQLSFSCIFVIGVAFPFIREKIYRFTDKHKIKWAEKIFDIFGLSLCVQMGLAPLTAFYYNSLPAFAVILNPFAVFLAGLIVPAGAAACGLGGAVSCGAADLLCRGLAALSQGADGLLPHFTVCSPPLGLLLLFYGVFFFYFSETRCILLRKKKQKACAGIWAAIVVLCCILPWAFGESYSPWPWEYNCSETVFLDVGQGDCAHIRSGKINILVDGGGKYGSNIAEDILQPYLLHNGVSKIDLAFVTHLDMDHSKGIAQLSNLMDIETIVFPVSCKEEDLSAFKCKNKVFVQAGDVINLGKNKIEILWPYSKSSSENENDLSLVFLYKASYTYLFTADITSETERVLGSLSQLKASILKVAHHGSPYSSTEQFIQNVQPDIAVISVGENNNYGHPAGSVLELLKSLGIIIRRTDIEGAICIKAK